MKRSSRMEKLNAINNGIKSLAGASLARAENDYNNQLQQLEQLQIYKDEYAEQLKQRLQTNVSSEEIRDYRYFFASLYKAITQQESIVGHLKAQVDECRKEWLLKDQEVRKLDVISENLRIGENQMDARLEQKGVDEMNTLAFGRYSFGHKH